MTITTAKRIVGALPRLAPLTAALLIALPAQAQWRVTPGFSLSETFTDNVNLQSDDYKRSQWVSEATPFISLSGKNSRLQLTANARANFYAFSNGRSDGSRSNNSSYGANGKLKVIDELFYIDANANGGSRDVSAFGVRNDTGNGYNKYNSTDVKTWRVSPYLVQRFGNFAAATLRYTYDSVDAEESLYGSSTAQEVSLDLVSGRAWRDLRWNLHYAHQRVDNERYNDTAFDNALLQLNYRLHRTLQLTASAGYDRYDYETLGGRSAGRSWSGGLIWTPSLRTSLDLSLGRHYFGQTGALTATHRSRHTNWSLRYSDGVTTTRSQFTLPQALDTAALLDGLFTSSIPDPELRRQAVAAYLSTTGLPASLMDDVNYLTNRYFRQKQAQASVVIRWGKHGTVLSASASERNALSSGQSDSGLLGSQLFELNDNVRQYGLSAAHSYRLNALSSATAELSATRSQSLTTAIEQEQKSLRLGLDRRFGRKLLGRLELRHVRGERDLNARGYTENAVSATLSAQI